MKNNKEPLLLSFLIRKKYINILKKPYTKPISLLNQSNLDLSTPLVKGSAI